MARIPIRLSSPRKYQNRKTVVDNITFDSAKEAKRYQELKLLQRAGKIDALVLQVPYAIKIDGQPICIYVADFTYIDLTTNKPVVEDAKGFRTREYKLKKKLLKAVRGIEIQEV